MKGPSANCRNWKHGPILDQSWLPKVGQCYWANISVQIGPIFSQYWHRTLAFQIYQTSAETWPSNGTSLGRESILFRKTMLEVEKPEFGPSVARYSAGHNLPVYWQPVTGKWRWPSLGCQVAALRCHFGNGPVLAPSLGHIFASTGPTLGRLWFRTWGAPFPYIQNSLT